MSHETQYLPGTIRDRIQDLMKSRKISQPDRQLTSEAMTGIFAQLKKNSNKVNRNLTAEQLGDAVAQSVSHLPGIESEQVKQLFLALTGTVTNHEQGADD